MARIFFNATRDQIQFAGALAANAAEAVGLGLLHYRPEHEFTAKEMADYWIDDREFKIDYAEGRCTKFAVWTPRSVFSDEDHGKKWMTALETNPDYETWCHKYPTYEDLLRAAGITDMKVVAV